MNTSNDDNIIDLEKPPEISEEAYEFALDCYPDLETMTAPELRNALIKELADVRMLARHCTAIYSHCTNDRITKPNTLPSAVIAEMEDFWQWKE